MLQKSPEYYEIAKKCEEGLDEKNTDELLYLWVWIPVLMEYVKWVLLQAKKDGKQRLYFFARDGYPMYFIACFLCNAWNLKIDCRYLKISRYALRVPEYHLLREDCVNRICIGGIDVTFEKIMRRAVLTGKEIAEIARLTGYEGRCRQILSYQEIQQLKKKLQKQEVFFQYVYQHSRQAYPVAMGYLEQEGMLEEVSYGIVDSGWTGTLQQSLKNLLQTKKEGIFFEGYYFGLYEIPRGEQKEMYHSYYFTPAAGIRRKVYFSNSLFEAVCSEPSGMTIGYCRVEGSYVPVRERMTNLNQVQMERYAELLKEYLKEYDRQCRGAEEVCQYNNVRLVEQLLKNLMGKPSQVEVEAFGSSWFSDDVLEKEVQKVSADLSEGEIRQQHFFQKMFCMLGIRKERIRESAWIEGSIIKNGKHVKRNLRHIRWYKYILYIRKRMKNR